MGNNKLPPVRIGSRFFHKKTERVFRIAGASTNGREGACCLLDTETFVSYTGDFVTVRNIMDIDGVAVHALLGMRTGKFVRLTDQPSAFEQAGKAMKDIRDVRRDGSRAVHLTDKECETIARETETPYATVRMCFKRKSPIIGGDEA